MRERLDNIELRSDEVKDILTRPPHSLIRYGTTVICLILLLFFVGSFFFRYPDIIQGDVIVTTENPPAWIVAKATGRIKELYITDKSSVNQGDLIAVIDNPAITTDVIVGFPGETEEDFLETRKFLEKVHFYEMHIFKYSRRKGTVADKMKEQVADTVKSERSAVLLALEKAQSLEYRKMYIGKRLEVLIEELTEIDGRSYYTGYTKNYIRVAIAADEFKDNPVNDIYECMADKLICDGVTILARYN